MFFEESSTFDGSPQEVWRRASSVRDIPTYWHGTRSIVVVGESEGVVHAKVRFAFGGSADAEISIDDEKRVMTVDYKSGPFKGKQIIAVKDARLVASWDVRFRGVYRLAGEWNEGHLRSGTVHALERLVAGPLTDFSRSASVPNR